VIALLLLTIALDGDQETPSSAEKRGKPFWREVARECDIPPWATPSGLVNEAVTLLGSTDPEWRDDVGYGVVSACVYRKQRLGAAERRSLVEPLSLNLRKGIGETGNDSVLLRSFSALTLSIVAAAETREAALDAAGYRRLLDDALAYLRDERDVRGYDPPVGWRHSCAHTADLLKFLARSPRLKPGDPRLVLEAVFAKATRVGDPVYVWGEDERLARAVLSLVHRKDFDPASLDPWLAGFADLRKKAWQGSLPDPALLAAHRNGVNLLKSLFVLVSQKTPEPSLGADAARAKLAASLAKL
jgi:hypothetical protein